MNRTEILAAEQDVAVIARADLAGIPAAALLPAVVDTAPLAVDTAALAAFRAAVTEATRAALAELEVRPAVHVHHHHAAPTTALAAEQPVTVLPTTTAPPAYGGRYPSPAERAGVAPMAPLRHPEPVRHWGRALGITSAGVMLAGAATGVVVGTAAGPVGMVAGGIAGIVAGVVRGTIEQDREAGR